MYLWLQCLTTIRHHAPIIGQAFMVGGVVGHSVHLGGGGNTCSGTHANKEVNKQLGHPATRFCHVLSQAQLTCLTNVISTENINSLIS